jgi:hypothetical protein
MGNCLANMLCGVRSISVASKKLFSYMSRVRIPSGPLSCFLILSYNGLVGGPLPSGKNQWFYQSGEQQKNRPFGVGSLKSSRHFQQLTSQHILHTFPFKHKPVWIQMLTFKHNGCHPRFRACLMPFVSVPKHSLICLDGNLGSISTARPTTFLRHKKQLRRDSLMVTYNSILPNMKTTYL